ncbi:MAG: DUF3168 domain-containing protein [Hyphomicrobiales bacterium]
MTISPALALQTGLRAALLADADLVTALGGEQVFDDVPREVPFPYITIGDIETRDWSTQTSRGHEHTIALHVWSRYRGRKQVQELIADVDRILDGQSPPLSGYRLVNLSTVFWTAQREPDGEVYRGTVRLRAVTEPVE